jgi:ATP-dependent Clp protease protease subunit
MKSSLRKSLPLNQKLNQLKLKNKLSYTEGICPQCFFKIKNMNKKEITKQTRDFQLFARDHGISSLTLDRYSKITMNNSFTPTSIATNLPGAMTPAIIEERPLNITQMDVFSRLMMDRIIFLGTPINNQVANIINAQLLFLDSVETKDVQMYINSPGGSVYDGLGIYDTMQYVNSDISTMNVSLAASMAFVLLVAGQDGKRRALAHSRAMQHQPLGGAQGQASDIEITAKEIQKIKKELYEIIAKHTKQDYEKIWNDADRDHWMTAQEALDYGVIDAIARKESAESNGKKSKK